MEDSRWLKFLTIGLVLAALVVGYFLFTSRFASNSVKTNSQVSQATSSARLAPTLTPAPISKPADSTANSTYNKIASRNQDSESVNADKLPRTGLPAILIATFAASIMISGLGLRRFPH